MLHLVIVEGDAIGQVPYLNGGLFERTSLDDRVTDIHDSAFEPILGEDGLFYRYNFTIEESTPFDIEVVASDSTALFFEATISCGVINIKYSSTPN